MAHLYEVFLSDIKALLVEAARKLNKEDFIDLCNEIEDEAICRAAARRTDE